MIVAAEMDTMNMVSRYMKNLAASSSSPIMKYVMTEKRRTGMTRLAIRSVTI